MLSRSTSHRMLKSSPEPLQLSNLSFPSREHVAPDFVALFNKIRAFIKQNREETRRHCVCQQQIDSDTRVAEPLKAKPRRRTQSRRPQRPIRRVRPTDLRPLPPNHLLLINDATDLTTIRRGDQICQLTPRLYRFLYALLSSPAGQVSFAELQRMEFGLIGNGSAQNFAPNSTPRNTKVSIRALASRLGRQLLALGCGCSTNTIEGVTWCAVYDIRGGAPWEQRMDND